MAIEEEFDDFRPKRKWGSKKNNRNLDRFDHHRKVAIKRAKRQLEDEDDEWQDDSFLEEDECVSDNTDDLK